MSPFPVRSVVAGAEVGVACPTHELTVEAEEA